MVSDVSFISVSSSRTDMSANRRPSSDSDARAPKGCDDFTFQSNLSVFQSEIPYIRHPHTAVRILRNIWLWGIGS